MAMTLLSPACADGINWKPIPTPPLWCANGQDFVLTITVAEPFPEGTTSWIEIDDVPDHFADGVLSPDRRTFSYRVEAPGSDDTVVADRAGYRGWVTAPNADTGTDDNWKWFRGEVRRDDL